MNVVAVVVTHNRLNLLKECIHALLHQTHQIASIIVVNNESTDGTTEWLATQAEAVTTIFSENKGGTWGFYTGIKAAAQLNSNWIWIMDDDTIPSNNALEQMLVATPNMNAFGFLASKVVWTDNSIHKMNVQHHSHKHSLYNQYLQQNIALIEHSSFVSLLVNKKAIEQVGLPIKEFFIWKDDTEFTKRIIKAGWLAGLVNNSVVLHKTAANYTVDLFDDVSTNSWKYFYGIRNDLFVRKSVKGKGSYVRNILKNFTLVPLKIIVKRKSARWPFVKSVVKGTWATFSFKPSIEFL